MSIHFIDKLRQVTSHFALGMIACIVNGYKIIFNIYFKHISYKFIVFQANKARVVRIL